MAQTTLEDGSAAVEAFVAAVKAGDVERAGKLLDEHRELRAKLNDPLPGFSFDATPLLHAVWRNDRGMADFLLKAGADIDQKSHWWAGGFGVLDGDSELTSFLIERGATVGVHAAARLGQLDRLEALAAANPTLVNARGGDGQTPLHVARSVAVAEYLLAHGADIDARDIDHESTAAQYLVRSRPDVTRFLVARGCRTDILMAAALGDIDLVRRLLDADPACIRTNVSSDYFPMENPKAGGSIYIWTLGSYKTPHIVAREFGHQDVVQLLMERSPDEIKLTYACESGDAATCRQLLANDPTLPTKLTAGDRRRIADAANNNDAAVVRLMLESGWPVDARGGHGATPLHFAAWFGNAELVGELLRRGAPVDVKSEEFDSTPLAWAEHGSEHCWSRTRGDYPTTMELLRRRAGDSRC
jgi:ankyrin repeat protein